MRAEYLIVTPYYKEPPEFLRRCIESVKAQTVACDHLLVADGHPQDWVEALGVRHLRLDRSHGDFGNTPRGIGAQLAVSEGYRGIGFLDADNYVDPDHLQTCLRAAAELAATGVEPDYVIAKRRLVRPDLTVFPSHEQPGHVDTNCFFFLPGAFHVIPHWNLMPQELSPVGDRFFYRMIASKPLTAAHADHVTVSYLNTWAASYEARGETPPEIAKPNVDLTPMHRWIASLPTRELEVTSRRVGVRIAVQRVQPKS